MILIGAAFFAKRKMNGNTISFVGLENDSLQLRRDDFELS
jgi:hypothetical protein